MTDKTIEIATIKSRRDAIDFIRSEGLRQGYSATAVALNAGYSAHWLTAAERSGAMSLQGLIDVLGNLGYRLVVVR
jgi:hypothetical protein